MSDHSQAEDCASCKPGPHPYSKHWADGGACSLTFCPCTGFTPFEASKPPTTCSICGMRDHGAGKRCPYFRSPK